MRARAALWRTCVLMRARTLAMENTHTVLGLRAIRWLRTHVEVVNT